MLASYETVRGRRSGEDSLAVFEEGMLKVGTLKRAYLICSREDRCAPGKEGGRYRAQACFSYNEWNTMSANDSQWLGMVLSKQREWHVLKLNIGDCSTEGNSGSQRISCLLVNQGRRW